MTEGVHPNFLVIGAEKAGTTWLYARLAQHPDIYVPDTKEIHYFNKYDSNLNARDHFQKYGAQWYARFFQEHAGQSAVGEVTPMYLCDPEAPARIASVYPDIKLVAVLRNPVDRFVSHYWMAVMKGHYDGTLDEAIGAADDDRFFKRGNYGAQLEAYLRYFPRDRVKILIFEEMIATPAPTLAALATFLGVSPEGFLHGDIKTAENSSARLRVPILNDIGISTARFLRSNAVLFPIAKLLKEVGVYRFVRGLNRTQARYPPTDPALRVQLTAHYGEQIERVEQLLGRKITAWSNEGAPLLKAV